MAARPPIFSALPASLRARAGAEQQAGKGGGLERIVCAHLRRLPCPILDASAAIGICEPRNCSRSFFASNMVRPSPLMSISPEIGTQGPEFKFMPGRHFRAQCKRPAEAGP